MNNKEYKKISVNNLLALAHILDHYEEFNKKLKKFVASKYNRDDIYNLYKVSNGKFCLSPKARKFYEENKEVLDIINKYSSSSDFINYIYDSDGKYNNSCDLKCFYNYLNKNKNKIDNIVVLLEEIQRLSFDDIKFNEQENFENKNYEVYLDYMGYISFGGILPDINFLENMELIPNYQTSQGKITYRTNGSNYCMMLYDRDDNQCWSGKEIILNNLLFDIKCLPKSLKREDTIDKIKILKETKKEETASIRDLVNLEVKISDFEKELIYLNDTVERLENIKSKEKLKKVLISIKKELKQLKQLNDNEILENKFVTEEQIQAEKQLYIKRREFQYLDLD